jgi:plastocyanin
MKCVGATRQSSWVTQIVSMRPLVLRLALALTAMVFAWPAFALTIVRAQVVGPAGEPVEDAAVSLRPTSGQKTAGHAPAPASVAQHDREFVPYLTVVQIGAAVRFPNQDSIRHHVYSFSEPKKFEIKLYAGDAPAPIIFDKPGVVTMGCNVHDWMLGYIFVVDTPWFGKTDAHGQVQIDAVEDGQYEARVWHPRQRGQAPLQHITLAGPLQDPLRFVLDVVPRKSRYKPPADPLHYAK